MNVLFVCTGNVCRSPMAEAFLRHEAAQRGLHLDVRSTGTHAFVGRAATIDGRRIMQELGVPMDTHRTRELDAGLVGWADLIIGLSSEHARDVMRDHPDAHARTFTLKSFLALLDHAGPAEEQWLARLAEVRETVPPPQDADVEDPFGEREAAYRRVATEIRELIARMAEGLEERLVRT